MAPVRLGVIGCGIMGERLLRAACAHDPAVLVVAGAWDPAERAMRQLAAALPQVPRHETAAALVAASDCVYIASPPATHLDHARAAFAAGRAVFCEKPLAVDRNDAADFVREATKASERAAVNFPFASSFAVDQLQRWLAEGVIGPVRRADVTLGFATWPRAWQSAASSWLDGRIEGGFVREVGSHFLFLARRLFGPLEMDGWQVHYGPDPSLSERAVEMTLVAGGIPMSVQGKVGFTEMADCNEFRIVGATGSIRLRDWSFAERLVDGEWHQAADAMPNENVRPLVLRRQLDKVAALSRGCPQDLARLDEALDVLNAVELVLSGLC